MNNFVGLKIFRMSSTAHLPKYATDGAACLDFFTPVDVAVPPKDFISIPLGIKLEVPSGYGLFIDSRSGHGFKHGVRLANSIGVIDSDYRGELCVCLHNDRDEPLRISAGKAIAQGWLAELPEVTVFEVFCEEELTTTGRGAGGFGHTDKARKVHRNNSGLSDN